MIFFVPSSRWYDLLSRINQLERTVLLLTDAIITLTNAIQTQQEVDMGDFARLEADVTAQSTVIASVQTLLANLTAAIVDLKTQVTDPAAQAKIDALANAVEASSKSLTEAVVANTPAT